MRGDLAEQAASLGSGPRCCSQLSRPTKGGPVSASSACEQERIEAERLAELKGTMRADQERQRMEQERIEAERLELRTEMRGA